MNDLKKYRTEIDLIDEKIQKLINERADLAQAIGNLKKEVNPDASCYVSDREASILQKIAERNQGPVSNENLQKIYRQIISVCRSLEKRLQIAILGPLGTFSHEAALLAFSDVIEVKPYSSIKEVIRAAQDGEVDFCIVPIENSIEGVVTTALDSLNQTDLMICNEILLPVHHYLLSRNQSLQEITQVYSHPQALAQCQQWLEKNLPNAAVLPAKSSSQACMLAASEVGASAIAGELALRNYNLNVIAKYIEDEPNNTTRFYVLGRMSTSPTGDDKTSLLATIPSHAGTLAKLLEYFAINNINLTLIQSRPCKQRLWEYFFFIEMDGHQQDENVRKALQEIADERIMVKILGSFPKGI